MTKLLTYSLHTVLIEPEKLAIELTSVDLSVCMGCLAAEVVIRSETLII